MHTAFYMEKWSKNQQGPHLQASPRREEDCSPRQWRHPHIPAQTRGSSGHHESASHPSLIGPGSAHHAGTVAQHHWPAHGQPATSHPSHVVHRNRQTNLPPPKRCHPEGSQPQRWQLGTWGSAETTCPCSSNPHCYTGSTPAGRMHHKIKTGKAIKYSKSERAHWGTF